MFKNNEKGVIISVRLILYILVGEKAIVNVTVSFRNFFVVARNQ